ncbi:MAG: outer membrane protein assembly factor BamD [Holosporaceae bacterium]|jgi:outer membrane protein assembly factor BamD|nr:outer membrane protein assembly factor BamD [Holosporaceae bacterium]
MKNSFRLLSCFLVVGCSSSQDDLKNRDVNSLYKKARTLLSEKEYTDAASEFKNMEILFPYSSKSTEGQILSAYCYFLAASYMDAIREVNIFLRYHPSHKLVPYVLYLKAMCLYMQVSSVGRDQKIANDAKHVFVELVNRFPESEYYRDALQRIVILDDVIAAHEMSIGRYYQKNKSALAAINRYTLVATQLFHTRYASEAFYRIAECCRSFGLVEESENALAVLERQYPESVWAKKINRPTKK